MKNSSERILVSITGDASKEIEILKNIFGMYLYDEMELLFCPGHAMGLWKQWSDESKNTVKRCIVRGWLTMKWDQPSENGFQLWLLCHRDFLKDYELSDEEMRIEYHEEYQSLSVPTLTLTNEGKKILKDTFGVGRSHRRRYATSQD